MTVNELNIAPVSSFSPVYSNKIEPKHNYFSGNDNADSYTPSNTIVQKRIAQKLTEQADNYSNNDKYEEAETCYKEAISTKNNYAAPYYGLAKLYKNKDKTPQAVEVYEKLLQVCPDELEAQTLLGLCHKKLGNYDKAKGCFQTACNKDPKYDFAVRSLKEIDNLILAKTDPKLAKQLEDKQDSTNLRNALILITNNTPGYILDRVKDVSYRFGKTDSLSGHANIAQYENGKRTITVTEDYKWAAPEIVAAYLEHEDIHAADKDGITSISEEQDAYEESIKFWLNNNHGIKDPELDYAADLYNKSPQTLRNKVADIYRSRDKDIAEYSPNHGAPSAATGFFSSIRKSLGAFLGFRSN